jgi:N-acetylneuraminic acid mutarotase
MSLDEAAAQLAGPPTISFISPTSTTAGGPTFLLQVKGTGYIDPSLFESPLPPSSVFWNTTRLETSFVSNTELKAEVPAELVSSPGSISITVHNLGGYTSNAVTFAINTRLGAEQNGTWASIPPMPEARQEVGVVAAEGFVYVIGGLATGGASSNRVDIFDTHLGRWLQAPPLPIPVHHPMVAALGHRIYVAGGYIDPSFTPHAQTYEFDPDQFTWVRKADMPTARGAGAAASYGGKIYVFGGERNGQTVNEVAAYNPETNSWTAAASMPTPRNHHGAALAGGKIYLVGGRPGNLSANEEFDPTTETWTMKAPLPTGRSGIAVAALGRYVYAFGGEGNSASPLGTFAENEAYDVDAGAWIKLASMPLPRHGIGAGVVGNRIYIPAGSPIAGFGTTEQSDFFEVAQDILVPQFAVGAGYRSEIVISNPASRSVSVNISLFDFNGAPLVSTIDGASRSELSLSVPPLASRTIPAVDTSGTLRVGTARIRSNARISTFVIIRAAGGSQSTIYPVPAVRNSIFHVRLNRSELTNTGVAIANINSQPASVTLARVNALGNEVSRIERTLAAGGQLSRFIDEWFTDMQQGDFTGTITVRASQPISVVALGFGRDGVVSLPVSPIE